MSACLDLAITLRGNFRWLAAERGLDYQVSTDMLRIEVTFDALRELYRDRDSFSFLPPPVTRDQPLTFMGVSVYLVRHKLPAPGWRVINPMRPA